MRQNLRKPETTRARAQGAFLEALAALPWRQRYDVAQAAVAAGVHRATPYRWRAEDAAFAARWDDLNARRLEAHQVLVEVELAARDARRRRRQAELRPIYQQNAANARAAKRL